MICNYCGEIIVDDAVFCSYCGKRVTSISCELLKKYYELVTVYFKELKPKDIDVCGYFNPLKKVHLDEIFYQFCLNLQDYNMMPSVIGVLNGDRKDKFREVLLGYNKDAVALKYTEESLYSKFCSVFPVKNQDSKQNLWRRYANSIIDSCRYLSNYKNAEEFNKYIENFNGSLDIVYDMKRSIRGMGFALACNLIKDLGFTDYAKPDTHTRDVVAAMGFADDDISVIRAIQDIAKANNDTAFNVDRMIWLICSGNYFNDNIRMGSHKKELIKKIQMA